MMRGGKIAGHLAALFTISIWGATFISTKILLVDFTPQEILFTRFFLGWLALWAICPSRLKFTGYKMEALFACAGLSGVTLYFLFENIALVYTSASNVGVIVTMSPFFTAILTWLFFHGHKPGINFFAGFVLAVSGIALLSFNAMTFKFNPLGDFLACLAALCWGFYSIFTFKLALAGYGAIKTTRRIFFYGLVFMPPVLAAAGFDIKTAELLSPRNLGNLLFLGFAASALCFATWTFTVKTLGAVSASVYIYLVPVVTMFCAAVFLGEQLTPTALAGAFMAIAGLVAAEYPSKHHSD